MHAYSGEQIENISKKLRSMPPVEKAKRQMNKQEAIKLLVKEIKIMQNRGYSLDQIAETLRGEGLDISTHTLKIYLQRAKRTTKKQPSRSGAQSDPRPLQASGGTNPATLPKRSRSSPPASSQTRRGNKKETKPEKSSKGTFTRRNDTEDI